MRPRPALRAVRREPRPAVRRAAASGAPRAAGGCIPLVRAESSEPRAMRASRAPAARRSCKRGRWAPLLPAAPGSHTVAPTRAVSRPRFLRWGRPVVVYGPAGLSKDHPVISFLSKEGRCTSLGYYKDGFEVRARHAWRRPGLGRLGDSRLPGRGRGRQSAGRAEGGTVLQRAARGLPNATDPRRHAAGV